MSMIIILLLSSIPLISAISEDKQSKSLPDLIVDDIKMDVGSMPQDIFFVAKVRNIGDSPSGSWIDTRIRITWMFLGIIPIKQVYARLIPNVIGNLNPGESQWIGRLQIGMISSIQYGSYSFEYTVNPDQAIEEYDYLNNDYSEIFYVIFGYWLR